MNYTPPTDCPRCSGRVFQRYAGDIPTCSACGWEDYAMRLPSCVYVPGTLPRGSVRQPSASCGPHRAFGSVERLVAGHVGGRNGAGRCLMARRLKTNSVTPIAPARAGETRTIRPFRSFQVQVFLGLCVS